MARQGSVRIGPVSILVLIIVLCLAVMAVLAFTTSEAEKSITNRQVESTTELYVNEKEAQTFLADLDEALASARARNAGVQAALDMVKKPADWSYENGVFKATFEQDGGRLLYVELSMPTTATYEIMAWRATTKWDENDPDVVFWSSD